MVHATQLQQTEMLSEESINLLASRLALLPDLALPPSYLRLCENPSYEQREEHLRQLLLHQPAVFLERHVKHLTPSEREVFEPIRGDYEINHWLSSVGPSAGQTGRSPIALQRNRRLAYMHTVLMKEGYFDVHAMFMRAPSLYEAYMGTYRPPPPDTTQPASLAMWFLEQQDAATAQHQRAGGGAVQARGDASMSCEEDEEEEEEEEEKRGDVQAAAPSGTRMYGEIQGESDAQAQGGDGGATDQQELPQQGGGTHGQIRQPIPEELLDAMQQRFLCGEVCMHGGDAGKWGVHVYCTEDKTPHVTHKDAAFVDYARIDGDASLDDYLSIRQRDAEDAYFDATDDD